MRSDNNILLTALHHLSEAVGTIIRLTKRSVVSRISVRTLERPESSVVSRISVRTLERRGSSIISWISVRTLARRESSVVNRISVRTLERQPAPSLQKTAFVLLSVLTLCLTTACGPDDEDGMEMPQPCDNCPGPVDDDPLIEGPSTPTAYTLPVPSYLPRPVLDDTNPLTEEGIELGRRLFYDPIMGRDSAISCAECHRQELAFTDGRALAEGVAGREGRRSAMSLVNLAFNGNGFNWDGSSGQLWEQAIHPVENMLEMDEDWANVLERIRGNEDYRKRFRSAYGIDRRSELTREMVVKAIAQFENTIISADTHFDRVLYKNTEFFTEEEQLGADSLFFVEDVPIGALHPGCGHCHNAPSFGDNRFKNNGLDDVTSLEDFADPGFGAVTGNRFDNGKFRTPTLRNIALTAPYMHDGRFATLEEVIDHYAAGGHGVENEDPNITGFEIDDRKKAALVAFLHSLTDETLITDPRFSNPFE